ncbi:20453_t:CDS:2 [Funneliformis geosporum]|uniref:3139_t:CDS:1 n=1 Tax=Funneliformis geosporum TaxID=1117311 RepID=A0A9W4SH95_9GLOM|nr:3139_t:CDS:2 [Funneliformis geosporum]CAI2169842.1 20453_t:CDS:2 [Funneliformis geosporum]
MQNNTKIFKDSSILPIIYEANFTIALEITEEFESWLHEHLNETLNSKPGFRDAEVFQRDPQNDEGDPGVKHPDRVHKYFTVFFEVDNKESIEKYLREEAPKIQEALQQKFNQKDALVVSSRRILYPVSLWAKRQSYEKK